MVLPTMLPPAHSPTGTHGLACAGLELYGHASVGGWMAEYKQQQAEREAAAKAAEKKRKLEEALAAKKAAKAAAKAAWLLSPAGLAARPVFQVKLYVLSDAGTSGMPFPRLMGCSADVKLVLTL